MNKPLAFLKSVTDVVEVRNNLIKFYIMIKIENVIEYIKIHEKEFDLLDCRTITNKKLNFEIKVLQDPTFNWKYNSVTVSRFREDICSLRKEAEPYIIITDDEGITEEQADELYFLFKSIRNRIKKEIESEILTA